MFLHIMIILHRKRGVARMSVEVLMNYGYKHTCNVCEWIGHAFTVLLVTSIGIAESAGRARAASELSRMGYHEEAKKLMLERDDV